MKKDYHVLFLAKVLPKFEVHEIDDLVSNDNAASLADWDISLRGEGKVRLIYSFTGFVYFYLTMLVNLAGARQECIMTRFKSGHTKTMREISPVFRVG